MTEQQTLSTTAAAIPGVSDEWLIITESSVDLERFAGTKRAASRRAAKLHKDRITRLVSQAMHATWQAIGPDVEDSCKSAGVRLTNASAYESVLEHLEKYGPAHRDWYTREAIKSFKALSRQQQERMARQLLGKLV